MCLLLLIVASLLVRRFLSACEEQSLMKDLPSFRDQAAEYLGAARTICESVLVSLDKDSSPGMLVAVRRVHFIVTSSVKWLPFHFAVLCRQ